MRLQFDDLTFDSDTRQVWIARKDIRLSPKAFDLLALLIARRPKAVSKAEIREHLWPGTFVSDSNLPSLISEIRDAIADHRRKPGLLRTLHGFGYAFQAEQGSATEQLTPASDVPNGWLVGSTAEVALLAGENIIGREGTGVILVKSSTVSRKHARIEAVASRLLRLMRQIPIGLPRYCEATPLSSTARAINSISKSCRRRWRRGFTTSIWAGCSIGRDVNSV